MNALIVVNSSQRPFDREGVLKTLERIDGVSGVSGGANDRSMEAVFKQGAESVLLRLSADGLRLSIRGVTEPALAFCWALHEHLRGLRVLDQSYSFDVMLDDLESFDDFLEVAEG